MCIICIMIFVVMLCLPFLSFHFIFGSFVRSFGLYDVHSDFGCFVSVQIQAQTASAATDGAADLILLAYFQHTNKLKLFLSSFVCEFVHTEHI